MIDLIKKLLLQLLAEIFITARQKQKKKMQNFF